MSVFASRITAAVAARRAANSDIVIIARTDALAGPGGYEDALTRLNAAKEAGADVLFLEGVPDRETMKQMIADAKGMPVVLNMVEHGRTPTVSVQEAKELGFKLIIWPFAGIAPAMMAMKAAYKELMETGNTKKQAQVTPRDLFDMCGLQDWIHIDTAAGGDGFKNGA